MYNCSLTSHVLIMINVLCSAFTLVRINLESLTDASLAGNTLQSFLNLPWNFIHICIIYLMNFKVSKNLYELYIYISAFSKIHSHIHYVYLITIVIIINIVIIIIIIIIINFFIWVHIMIMINWWHYSENNKGCNTTSRYQQLAT